ncbi:acetyltransferase [Shewanella waksmanii]|uniref:acetyltransferase n=1 Tax=Shewanella waksmanii TaxID=213783 RepID=UPI00048C0EBD|nr:acetyltransferase [Shewanella waksmanii]
MKKIAILGASGHGKVVAEIAELCGYHVTFYDDAWPTEKHLLDWEVVGDSSLLIDGHSSYDGVFVAIGNNTVRLTKMERLKEAGIKLVSLVHPSAVVSLYAKVGVGSVIMANTVIGTNAILGEGTICNTACSVDHDCEIGDCVHISPGARLAGGVSVGDMTWIGIGASVIQQIIIGSNVVVGAGATVIRDVSDATTVVGSPATLVS